MRRSVSVDLEIPTWAVVALVFLALVLWTRDAGADDAPPAPNVEAEVVRIKSPSSVVTDGGSTLRLPPGYFLPDEKWSALDAEMRRLQEQGTRLEAENASLRKSIATRQPSTAGYVFLGLALAVSGGVIWLARRD